MKGDAPCCESRCGVKYLRELARLALVAGFLMQRNTPN
jgi:hypothetical protein